jgi:hypothetical protein
MKIKNKLKNGPRKTEVELFVKVESREQAMQVCRKRLTESVDELMFLARV